MHTQLYKLLCWGLRKQSKALAIESSTQPDEIRNAVRWVMRDNPDIFWFAHQYHYDETSSTIYFQYTFSAERVNTIQQSIADVINNDFCIEYVKLLTRQEQVAYVYKWLVTYCNYNANSAYNQSIYSVFVRRNSVCTGYAKAAQYLFNLLGIESRLVFGRLHNDKEDGRHCWNLVKVDNEYYHFDACFGYSILDNVAIKSGVRELVKIDGINYNFLCVSTDEILRTRSIEDIMTLPGCSTSWPKTIVKTLAQIKLRQREGIKGCLLSHIGSSADIHLCSKDKNTVLKIFRPNSKTASWEGFHYMQQTKGCQHILQCNEQYTDIIQNIIAIEQSTPIVDLLCSHYYELSLKGLIKMATDVAAAWKECQERGVLYRDIHVCNIYRSNDGTFKLGDFGSCTNDFDIKETVGNQWFMAPETFVSGIFTEASAIYSISMVMYFILNNLRPAFWMSGCEDEALQKRMNGHELPMPAGCVNIPSHLKTKLDNFFKSVSASLPKERISSIEVFIYELGKLTYYCGDRDYAIHCKGINLDLDLDAGNNDRLGDRWNYISRDAHHRYAMGDEVEQMCTTAMPLPTSAYTYDIASDDGIISVDEVEEFARTRGGRNDGCISAELNNSSDNDWDFGVRVDDVERLAISMAGNSLNDTCSQSVCNSHSLPPFDDNVVRNNNSSDTDVAWMDAFIIETDLDSINTTDQVDFTYESAFLFPSSPNETIIRDLEIAYEKIITHLTQEQKHLRYVYSQIDELHNKKVEINYIVENTLKTAKKPSLKQKIISLIGRTLIPTIIPGVFAAGHSEPAVHEESEDLYNKVLQECDKELNAKKSQVRECEKQIKKLFNRKIISKMNLQF